MQRSVYYLVFAGTLLIACCYGFARFAYGLFTPALSEEFVLTPTTVGFIGSGSYVGYCVAIVASSVLTQRIGARRVSVIAGVVATLGISLVSIAPSAQVLAAGVLIAGSSTGIASPPLASAVARWVNADVRDRAQTVVNAGTGIGVVMTAPIALFLFGQWRIAWAVMAVIAAVVTVIVARAIPASAEAIRSLTPRPGWRAGAAGLVVASLLTGLGSVAVWTFGRLLADGLGNSSSVVAWTVLGAAGIVGAFSGDAVDRLGLVCVWRLGVVSMTGATLVYALFPHGTAVLVAAAGIFGAAYIALTGLLLVWATRVYPDSASFGVGMSFFAIAAGQALSAPAVGAVAEATTLTTAIVLVAVLGMTAMAVTPVKGNSLKLALNRGSGSPCGAETLDGGAKVESCERGPVIS